MDFFDIGALEWQRIQDDASVQLFSSDGPALADINTGCYFAKTYLLSTVATLLEKDPSHITGMFVEQDTQSSRGYTLRVHTGDGEHLVSVDDWDWIQKCNSVEGAATTENDTMWMSLMEKALAKAFGNYERLVDGTPAEAMKWITGRPAYSSQATNGAEANFFYI